MLAKLSKLIEIISNANLNIRKTILILIDILIIKFVYLFSINLEVSYTSIFDNYKYTLLLVLITILVYLFSGQYKPLTRYIGSIEVYKLAIRNLLVLILFYLSLQIFSLRIYPISFWMIYFILCNSFITLSRFTLRDILIKNIRFDKEKIKNIVIYGASQEGAKLAVSMRNGKEYNVKFFIDESKSVRDRDIAGLKIYSPDILHKKKNIDQIVIALPNLRTEKLKSILKGLYKYDLPILLLNSNYGITSKISEYKNIRPLDINDLLGRENVLPDLNLMKRCISKKNVLITGAGGSIGSQLSKQILKLDPEKLFILDFSEINLYQINSELNKIKDINNIKVEVISILGSVSELNLLDEIFSINNIDVVFHAAAYKHVPLVETNPLSGIFNNILSTKNICEVSLKYNVEKVILISTDKAVRPTNVMGKSKRVAELIIQAHAKQIKENFSIDKKNTIFSMVRFGNVLASSGSVVPLFKKQILDGGPVTITHPEIVRYFMTIEEAAQLLIQSGSLAKGGDVFLLDMGQPVKIYDLAKQMIKLAGLSLQSEENINGDIKIVFSGLRPGEKLYEELLIDSESKKTKHPLIFTAEESFIPYRILMPKIESLLNSTKNRNLEEVYEKLDELVD